MATKFQTPDFAKAFEGYFKAMPQDFSSLTDTIKDMVEFGGKMTAVSLTAAQKNVELSAAWTKDVLSEMQNLTQPQGEIADYAKNAADFATKQLQATPERLAEFAEVAKAAQVDATELMMDASKSVQAKFSKAA